MATTDLTSKSLGDILIQSGIGTPDHNAAKGSLYTDKNTGVLYQNKTGAAIWESLVGVSYGEGFYQGNTSQTTISATNTWYSVGNTFTAGDVAGVTISTNTLVVETGRGGLYEITGNVTLAYVAGTNNYEIGISINGANPAAGAYNGENLSATYDTASIGVKALISLNAGDTIRFAVRSLTSANNVIVRNTQLIARKTM